MRPPRLKLRTLIVLVALATLAVGGVEYRRRAARYRALAARETDAYELAKEASEEALRIADFHGARRRDADAEQYRENARIWKKHMNRRASRRAAYLRCARCPWLAPPADEAEPK